MADTADLKSAEGKPSCGFKSRRRQTTAVANTFGVNSLASIGGALRFCSQASK